MWDSIVLVTDHCLSFCLVNKFIKTATCSIANFHKQAKKNKPCRLRSGLSWFNWWVSFAPDFQCCHFCESSCLFYLRFNFEFYVSEIMHL